MLYYILFNDYYTPREAVIVFLITIFVYLISLTLHEFAHSLTAYRMGDPTPKLMGRLTLNPFKHLSLGGFLMFVLLGIGWAKPVPIFSIRTNRGNYICDFTFNCRIYKYSYGVLILNFAIFYGGK